MELSVASANWAWGLLSLAVPLLIHFFARRWQRPTRFAALRFLPGAAAQGRARRLSDWWLLLLRLLLLTLLVLGLMAPHLRLPVSRDQALILRHPDLFISEPPHSAPSHSSPPRQREPLDASTSAHDTVHWLCRDGTVQPLAQHCPADGQHFLDNLQLLIAREPQLAELTVQVPAALWRSALPLPALPVRLHWQVIASDAGPADNEPVWIVRGPVEYEPLFVAANALSAPPRWRWQPDAAAADLIIADPAGNAPVLWHDAPLPWRDAPASSGSENLAPASFHVDGEQLHLQVSDMASLADAPTRLAALLARSDHWLGRGRPRWLLPAAAAEQGLAVGAPAAPAIRDLALQPMLFMLALLLLLAERGLVHGRR